MVIITSSSVGASASVVQLGPARSRLSAVRHVVWRSVQVTAGVLVVVVPFGYAVTPMHVAVLMAAGSAFAVGVGLRPRMDVLGTAERTKG